jgi:hypothetical protein
MSSNGRDYGSVTPSMDGILCPPPGHVERQGLAATKLNLANISGAKQRASRLNSARNNRQRKGKPSEVVSVAEKRIAQ